MIIEALLSRKALDSIFDSEGLTALHYAVHHQHIDCVRIFMLLEAPSHLPDLEFRTPLMYASVLSNVPILTALLSHPEVATQINAVDKQENSCLLYTLLATQSPETMRILLQSGADPNTMNTSGYNALHICCQTNNIEVAVLLIESGVSITLPDLQDNLPPIHIAVRHTSIDVLGLLAVQPLSVNLVTQDGLNALHFAAQLGDFQLVQILLNSPLKPSLLNALDAAGLAPIHHAVLKRNTAVVELLCEFGAYLFLQLVEYDFDTCVDLAVNDNSDDVIAVLRKYGASTNFELRTNAAIVIQRYIRGYSARLLFSNLKISSKAVTVISANFRSFQARLKYKALKRDHLKATVIQAFFRGYRQRKQFVGDLAKFRAVRTHNEYIDSIHKLYLEEIREDKIKTFTIKDLDFTDCLFISPWRSSLREKRLENIDEQTRRLENEQYLRVENAMLLRGKLEKDKCSWFKFLESERERREGNFRLQNRQRNLKIIRESKQRRTEITEKYSSTRTLQHKIHSAIVIQRAFRAWIHFAGVKKRKNAEELVRLKSHEKAACIIQKHWRSHQFQILQREFRETVEVLETNIDYPIAVFGTPHHHQPTAPLLTRSRSYQADTLLTLNPRRKLLMPPSRDVLIEAKKDLLTISLPEGRFAELKEITQAGKTSSIVDLNRYTPLTAMDLNLSCPTRKLKHISQKKTESVKIFFSSIDKGTNESLKKKSKFEGRNMQTVLPLVRPENNYNDTSRNIPSSSSVTSLPPILQK